MTSKKILLVEDDHDISETMCALLGYEGYTVKSAPNGRIALDLLKSSPQSDLPDCIILDLMMPVMDGHQFMLEILEHHKDDLAKIPILLSTAARDPKSMTQDVPLNFEILRKPLDIDVLYEALERRCRKH